MKMLEVSSEFNLKLNSLDEQSIKMQIREELLDLRLNQEKKIQSEEPRKKLSKNEQHLLDDIKILTFCLLSKGEERLLQEKLTK